MQYDRVPYLKTNIFLYFIYGCKISPNYSKKKNESFKIYFHLN